MKIIISPAKQMVDDYDFLSPTSLPMFYVQSERLISQLKQMNYTDLKKLWGCNDSIARTSYEQLQANSQNAIKSPAILTYNGIAFKYMAPSVLENNHFNYVVSHLYILSGLYGILRPMDGIQPYRLEMQAKLSIDNCKDLYDFWGSKIYDKVFDNSRILINLASKEYSKCVEKYLTKNDTFITCVFGEYYNGNIVQKGVYAKMARGEAVRFMAENSIENPVELKKFNRLGYKYEDSLSDYSTYTFVR